MSAWVLGGVFSRARITALNWSSGTLRDSATRPVYARLRLIWIVCGNCELSERSWKLFLLDFLKQIFRKLSFADIVLSEPSPKLPTCCFRIAPCLLRVLCRLGKISRIVVVVTGHALSPRDSHIISWR